MEQQSAPDFIVREAIEAVVEAKARPGGCNCEGDGGASAWRADHDSDLDLLVVKQQVEDASREEVRLRRTLRGLGLFADIVVVSSADARRLRDVPGSVVGVALAEGRVLAA